MSYKEIIRAHPDEDDYKVARRIIEEAPEDLIKIVADRVGSERRLFTLEAERAAFAQRRKPEDASPETRDRLAEIMAGVKNEAVVYEKGKPPVEWENLTRDQIRRRIAMLAAIKHGIDETIQRLTLLLEFLEQNGIDRYSELEQKPPRRRRKAS